MNTCPCCSGNNYTDCCGPIINSASATSALTLMRSRYTAFYAQQAEYLYNTTHPKTRIKTAVKEIEEWSKENTWTELEIIKVEKGTENDTNGSIEFKAYFTDMSGIRQIHHEKSSFLKVDEKWFYVDGIINPKPLLISKTISRNAPCFCGSGMKYKNCCG